MPKKRDPNTISAVDKGYALIADSMRDLLLKETGMRLLHRRNGQYWLMDSQTYSLHEIDRLLLARRPLASD